MWTQFSWIRVIILVGITVPSDEALRCYQCYWATNGEGGSVPWCRNPSKEHLPRSRRSIDSPTAGVDYSDANRAGFNVTDTTGVNDLRATPQAKKEVCVTLSAKDTTNSGVAATYRGKHEINASEIALNGTTEICKPGNGFQALFSKDPTISLWFLTVVSKLAEVQQICVCDFDGCNNRSAAGRVVKMSSLVFGTLLLSLTSSLY